MNGTGTPTSQPATSTGLRPTRSASAPATRFVTAFVSPNATRKARAAVARRQAEDLDGEQRHDRPLLADHPADERADPDEQRELAGVRAQAEDGLAGAGRAAIGPRLPPRPQVAGARC